MTPPSHDRALEIDGIRGWASFFVLFYHTFHEMFTHLAPWVNSPWISPLFQGRLSVCVFFVLSGDALTTTFFARGGTDPSPVDRLALRRYTRLTIPIAMSCALVAGLRAAHADWHAAAAVVTSRPDWLGGFIEFDFSAISLLRYSLLGVYTAHSKATSYNPFLWTMSLEMVGSMLVFLTCYIWPRLARGRVVLVIAALTLFALDSFLCLFFAGMYLGLLRSEGFFEGGPAKPRMQVLWLVLFVAAVLLLVVTHGHQLPLLFDLGMGIIFVWLLYAQRSLRSFLRGRLSTWLGDVSFPVYLVQFAVIISYESWAVTVWASNQKGPRWLLLIGASTVGVTLLAAWLFRRVEAFLLRSADRAILRALRRT